MFPELQEEPDAYKYDKYREIFLQMSPKEQEDERGAAYYKYSYELELPYGEWKLGYYYKLRSNEQAEKQELPEDQMRDTFKFKIEPEPISADQ